jgi:hypothetical protein
VKVTIDPDIIDILSIAQLSYPVPEFEVWVHLKRVADEYAPAGIVSEIFVKF